MSYGQYPTPAHVSVYIGDLHIDDCYDIRWNVEDSTRPLFDYSRRKWQAMATGKSLVSGSLATSYRYPGYLTTAIDHALKTNPDLLHFTANQGEAALENLQLKDWFEKMSVAPRAERFKLLAEASSKGSGFFKRASRLTAYLDEPLEVGDNGETVLPHDYQGEIRDYAPEINVEIVYGDLNELHVGDRLMNVRFIGASKTISAGAVAGGGVSSSGAPLFEIYPFVAREVVPFRRNPQNTFLPALK